MHASIRPRWAARSVLVLAALLLAVPACSTHRSGSGAPYPAAGTRGTMVTSPRSALYVFMQAMPPLFTWDLFIFDLRTRAGRMLTTSPGNEYDPAWSPNGAYIVFASDLRRQTGFRSLYVIKADGSALRRLTATAQDDSMPSWSPSGTQIVFARRPAMRV
jgi:dipeptidyl aminopeptidase/acylaminoacyl peptidase